MKNQQWKGLSSNNRGHEGEFFNVLFITESLYEALQVKAYLHQVRIHKSKKFSQNPISSTTTIELKVGYNDSAHFLRDSLKQS